MKHQNWIALLIAVLIPSAALLVVRLRPEPAPERQPPRPRATDAGPGRPDGFEQVEANLLRLRDPLGLTTDQIKKILDATHGGRRELAGIKLELDGLELELDRTLRLPEVPRETALSLLRRIHELRLRADTLRLTIPLDIRAVLTPDQREKLLSLTPGDDRPDDAMPPPRDDRPDDAMPPPRDDHPDDDRRLPRDDMRPPRDGMRPPRDDMRPAQAEPVL